MSIIERIISLFAPHACLDCGAEQDRLLCRDCVQAIATVPSRCYICRATTREYHVCRACRKRTPLRRVLVATPYQGAAKELLHSAKYERAVAGLQEIGDCMGPLVRDNFAAGCLLIPVPTASSRVRQRGYDQAVSLARILGKQTSLPWAIALVRRTQGHQVGSNRTERIAHVKDAFRVVGAARLKGAHIVLVDDVVTTGATLEEAARTLKRAGASQVDAVVFAQPS